MKLEELEAAARREPRAKRAYAAMSAASIAALFGSLGVGGALVFPVLWPLGVAGGVVAVLGLVALPFTIAWVARRTGERPLAAAGTAVRLTARTVRQILCSLP